VRKISDRPEVDCKSPANADHMITAVFESQHLNDWSLALSSPSKTITATTLQQVVPLLETAESEAMAGNYVAVMLCYESAPAFDSALTTHHASALPLAWAGVFPQPSTTFPTSIGAYDSGKWIPAIDRSEYDSAVKSIAESITKGDTYQVNYTFPLTTQFAGDAFSYYRDLHIAQGSQYSAFLDLGKHKILSLSPELFFTRNGDRVRTRPMKGTVRRGRWMAEDMELASWLANSEKDKAENVMIVDLLRNDLGRVSIPGSVSVTSLYDLERFETVWQMTSTVESTLRPGTSFVELMRALFPCGSITGAPKIRTMEIINRLEPQPRGIYTGTIGFLRPGGDCIFNVAIRTVVIDVQTNQATLGVGGGVTIDSTAEREYEECLLKSRFLEARPQLFDLFESILLEDGVYFLRDRHIERLRSSAEFFGFEFDESSVNSALESVAQNHTQGKWKARLSLTRAGEISTNLSEVLPNKEMFRVGISRSPVDSSDRLLFHKTTHREFYSSELATQSTCDDLIFFNEHGEVTESAIANVVVRANDGLVTPPITSGLLAGTFRDQLIADGLIKERTISIDELRKADELFLINSVRKWMKAVLVNETVSADYTT